MSKKSGCFLSAAAIVAVTGLFIYLAIRFFPRSPMGRVLTLSRDGRAFKAAEPALAELQTIASGADAMRAMPDPLADMDPLPPVPTDAEIRAQIDADHRAAMAADEARMAGEG